MIRSLAIISMIVMFVNVSYSQNYKRPYLKSEIYTQDSVIKCYLSYESNYSTVVSYRRTKDAVYEITIPVTEVIKIKKPYDTFDKITYKGKEYLMHLLTDGEVKLYKYHSITQTSMYGFNAEGRQDATFEKTTFYILKNGQVYRIRKYGVAKDLRELLTGNEEIDEMIRTIDKFTLEYDLKQIVTLYNNWKKYGEQ